MFVFLILDLSVFKDVIFLLSFGSLDHRYGPKYLIECLPYLTVLKFGMLFSVLNKLYLRDLVTNMSLKYVGIRPIRYLNIVIEISCSRLL